MLLKELLLQQVLLGLRPVLHRGQHAAQLRLLKGVQMLRLLLKSQKLVLVVKTSEVLLIGIEGGGELLLSLECCVAL